MQENAKTVLLVDDHATILSSVKAMLLECTDGMVGRVLTAGSKNEALKILDQEPVDMVITDCRMQGKSFDGIELINAMRRRNLKMPVILHTSQDETVVKPRLQGCSGDNTYYPKSAPKTKAPPLEQVVMQKLQSLGRGHAQ